MRWLAGAAVLTALLAAGCVDDDGSFVGTGCGPGGTCDGTDDCYSRCACETPASECERECAPRGVRVNDLDESEWLADWREFEDEVVRLTNEARAEGGCCGNRGCFRAAGPLDVDALLVRSARSHARDMVERGYFAHESPEGLTPFDRMREAGFRGCTMAENIAAGQPSPASVVEGWRDSPGHCANMLDSRFEQIGVGYRPAPDQDTPHFWVQNFGG